MKQYSKIFTGMLLLSSLCIISCTKDDPNEEGPTPVTDDRDKYIGTWKCQENSSQTGTNPVFNISIAKSTANSTDITIANFYNFGTTVKSTAIVSGNAMTIPTQVVSGNTVKGSGTLQGTSTINLNYTVFDGSLTDTVAAVLTKM